MAQARARRARRGPRLGSRLVSRPAVGAGRRVAGPTALASAPFALECSLYSAVTPLLPHYVAAYHYRRRRPVCSQPATASDSLRARPSAAGWRHATFAVPSSRGSHCSQPPRSSSASPRRIVARFDPCDTRHRGRDHLGGRPASSVLRSPSTRPWWHRSPWSAWPAPLGCIGPCVVLGTTASERFGVSLAATVAILNLAFAPGESAGAIAGPRLSEASGQRATLLALTCLVGLVAVATSAAVRGGLAVARGDGGASAQSKRLRSPPACDLGIRDASSLAPFPHDQAS